MAPTHDPAWADVTDLDELPGHRLSAIENFFDVYKMLDEESSASADGRGDARTARQVLAEARQRHQEQQQDEDPPGTDHGAP